jgi:nucleoside-diphosphate kinase
VERKGYRLESMSETTISRDVASRHYAEHEGKPFYDDLIDYITGGPSVVAIVKGENAIENLRMIMGSTDPLDATPGSIRGAYATSVTHNLVHGSDSAESAARELALFFPAE